MWSSLSQSAAEWQRLLDAENGTYDNSVVTASANAICAARRFNEIFIGGDETPCLVQLLCAPKEHGTEQPSSPATGEGDADMLASVLLPTEDVEVAFTARGSEAARLVASFWNHFPRSPALLQSGGDYHRLMCELPAGGWTQGALCPHHLRALQQSAPSDANSLRVYVPGQRDDSATEEKRAAVRRPQVQVLRD
jgi:hypothetical protein